MTVAEIKEYARKEMRDIRTGIKDMFKEEHYNALIYNILDMLDQLDEWVSVDDRLPKDRDYYLVCGKENHEIGFACYNQDLGVWYLSPDDMHYGDYEIIAWKPLPQPYERKE